MSELFNKLFKHILENFLFSSISNNTCDLRTIVFLRLIFSNLPAEGKAAVFSLLSMWEFSGLLFQYVMSADQKRHRLIPGQEAAGSILIMADWSVYTDYRKWLLTGWINNTSLSRDCLKIYDSSLQKWWCWKSEEGQKCSFQSQEKICSVSNNSRCSLSNLHRGKSKHQFVPSNFPWQTCRIPANMHSD